MSFERDGYITKIEQFDCVLPEEGGGRAGYMVQLTTDEGITLELIDEEFEELGCPNIGTRILFKFVFTVVAKPIIEKKEAC